MQNVIDLHPYDITRPEKLRWWFHGQPGQNVIDSVQSKTLRQFLRDVETDLTANDIRWEYKEIDFTQFQHWLPFYTQQMRELGYEALATEEWFHQKAPEGKVVEGIFFYQHNEPIGSGIIARRGTELATLAFRASKKIEISKKKNSNLGAVIDYFFLKLMTERGVSKISGGRSLNAFGVSTPIGYVEYKLKFYQPEPAVETPLLHEVPVSADGTVLFYGIEANTPAWYFFSPPTVSPPDFRHFATGNISMYHKTYEH